MKTLGQIGFEAVCPALHWEFLPEEYQLRYEIIAKAVADEAVRRMADAVVEEAKVFRSGSHN